MVNKAGFCIGLIFNEGSFSINIIGLSGIIGCVCGVSGFVLIGVIS